MKQNQKTWCTVTFLAAGLLLTPISAPADEHDSNKGNKGIFPPDSRPFGLTYGEWSAKWWQWAYSLPVDKNPIFDETNCKNGANGQSGPVWFLTGVINTSGKATRTCTVPEGKALFFPILNSESDNLCPEISPPHSVEGLRALSKGIMDGATNLRAEVDGAPIQGLNPIGTTPYRVLSPVFDSKFPNNNILQFSGCWGKPPVAPAGEYGVMVSDGVFLMLEPLSGGHHTIHFSGQLPAFGFTLDITYHLAVQ
jgi:hypothetical protein